jgi:hypothetical protein
VEQKNSIKDPALRVELPYLGRLFFFLFGQLSFHCIDEPLDSTLIYLSLEKVAVGAVHEVSIEVDFNGALIVGDPQGF